MRIIGLGNVVLDYYLLNSKILVNGGHTISNILANLSSMGFHTAIYGYYGNDILGSLAKKSLEDAKVETTYLTLRKGKTKCFFIQNGKTTSTCPFCKMKRRDFHQKKGIENILLYDDIVLIKDYTVLPSIKNKVCLDLGYKEALLYESISNIENFLFRDYFIANIKASVLNYLLKRLDISWDEFKRRVHIDFLVITKGKKGVTILYQGKEYTFVPKILEELETNGCGDVFLATMIAEFIKRRAIFPKDLQEMVEIAQNNVGVVLQHIGARSHLVPNKEIEKDAICICEDFIVKS